MSGGAHSTHDEPALGKAYDARLMRRLARYVAPHRAIVLGALALMLLASAAQLVQPWLVKVAIDEHIAKGEPRGLGTLALAFLAALAGEFVLRFAELYVLQRAGQDVLLDLRMAVFAHLERLSSSFFDRHPVGRLMTRLTTDVEALNEAFTSGLIVALADGAKLLAIVVILLWMDWRLALVTFAILPPTLFLTALFRPRMREAYRAVRRWIARVNAFLQESVSGMRVLQLFSRERAAMDQFREINGAHRDAQLSGVRYDSMFSALAEWIGAIALAAIVAGGGWGILEGIVTFGTLVAFIDYAGKFFGPVQELSQRYTIMQSAMASAERIFELLDTEVAIRSPVARPSVAPRARGEIVFEGVTFGYNPGEPVLRDVTLHIRPGERVGVVGWTGSGKSTLIRLLVRLYDVWDGRILLDGVDVRDYDVSDLRRRIGLVLQDPFLFAGSVASNISLDDPAITPERVRGAARTAHADRFVELLPRGYDEPVRERGSNFSVGQKQLLSFARAVAFDPAVLVLDEATASVDPATEHDIREGLARLLAGRTSIVIAHRLATVRDADRVLVLHHGRLVEQGSHEELLRLPEGIYRTLYGLQAAR
jgi:ATP-binding cassette subfamily B multidrug efflux pump